MNLDYNTYMKILILEDEPISMKKLSNDLKSYGHETLEASDGIEALNSYYNNKDIDLVITDLAMPFGKGEDFIREIKALKPTMPIVVISGTVDKEILNKLKIFKCTDILVKPHDKDRLKLILDSL